MTRTTRRETNRLRAEIMDGIGEYLEDRDRAERIRRCGTLVSNDALPANWLNALVRASAPHALYVPELRFGVSRPQPLLH